MNQAVNLRFLHLFHFVKIRKKIMKKKEIIFLSTFSNPLVFYNQFEKLIKKICKNFKNIYFVNYDNLVNQKKTRKYDKKLFLNISKKIKFFNPIDFNSLDLFLKNKNPVIIINITRIFKYYRLLFYLKRKNIPLITVAHAGHKQSGSFGISMTESIPFKLIFNKLIPLKITALLSSLGILPKIDVRFTSNKLIYDEIVKQRKKFFKLPSSYKEFILVKSKQFDEDFYNKKKLKEDILLIIDFDPDHWEFLRDLPLKHKNADGKVSQNIIDKHYKNLINLLEKLKKTYRKKIIVSIHPAYNLEKTIQRFKGRYPVIKYKTRELIQKSFLVLDLGGSSSIIDAVVLKKKIIAIRSKMTNLGKKYSSDFYKDLLNLKAINIDKRININGKKLIRTLNSRIKYYDEYLKKYAASDLKISGNKEIIRTIKSRYF